MDPSHQSWRTNRRSCHTSPDETRNGGQPPTGAQTITVWSGMVPGATPTSPRYDRPLHTVLRFSTGGQQSHQSPTGSAAETPTGTAAAVATPRPQPSFDRDRGDHQRGDRVRPRPAEQGVQPEPDQRPYCPTSVERSGGGPRTRSQCRQPSVRRQQTTDGGDNPCHTRRRVNLMPTRPGLNNRPLIP